VGKVKDRNILSELALVLGIDEKALVLKLLTINALLLEQAKKEGVQPEEFFEGCLYIPKEVREKLGENWKESFKEFLKEVQSAHIKDPLEEAVYWIRKLSVQLQQSGLREMTIFVDEKTFDEFVETANKAIELGIVKEGYTQEVGKQIASLVRNSLLRETKLLKDKMLRLKMKGR
jgi:bifunctional DNA-binding transcriptional regulator/antitoxin component of YhaV-PrlF toxin-antitoxin module